MAWYKYEYEFPKSLSVGERKAKALRAAGKLGRKQALDPVIIEGPLASTWWGRAWNQNLEGYADFSNRLPRGRSYARHGSVIDLRIVAGSVTALVQGSRPNPYQVQVAIDPVSPAARKALAEACSGKLESAEALLAGRFPEEMERLLTSGKTGLFPHPRGIRFSCSCPDSASLCKHVAAALYGVGSRLDRDPSLFFLLRKVEMADLVTRAVRAETRKLLHAEGTGESLRLAADNAGLEALFGIEVGKAGEAGEVGEAGEPGRTEAAPEDTARKEESGPQGASFRPGAGKIGKRTEARLRKIRTAVDAIEALSGDLAGLEAELKSLLKPRRGRKPPAR